MSAELTHFFPSAASNASFAGACASGIGGCRLMLEAAPGEWMGGARPSLAVSVASRVGERPRASGLGCEWPPRTQMADSAPHFHPHSVHNSTSSMCACSACWYLSSWYLSLADLLQAEQQSVARPLILSAKFEALRNSPPCSHIRTFIRSGGDALRFIIQIHCRCGQLQHHGVFFRRADPSLGHSTTPTPMGWRCHVPAY